MLKKFLGIFLILLLPQISLAVDKSKKAYELIYEDVQLLKQQLLRIEEKIGKNAEDIRLLKDQFKELLAQMNRFLTEQANVQGNLKNIPSQYQVLLDKFEQINLQLIKIYQDFLAIKSPPQAVGGEPQLDKKEEKPPSTEKRQKEEKKEVKTPEKAQPSVEPSLSPKEVFEMAYSDYLKGNFELAIDGFKIYQEQFPDSPLADDALYWIGECYFSQKKFNEAITSFNDLVLNYPRGDKIAAAYLKKGICYMELGKKEEALLVFKLLIGKYPLEEETKIAQQKIKELSSKNERYQQPE